MCRFICSTISIVSVLGVLTVGCGSNSTTSSNPIVGKGGAGGSTGTKGSGDVKAGAGGSGTVKGSQGGSTAVGGSLAADGNNAVAGSPADATKICGDGKKNRDEEQCDGEDVGDNTCETLEEGTTGKPGCTEECILDTNVCTPVPVVDSGNQDGEISYGG